MKTTFNTNKYVGSYGKDPKGYGMWAFRIVGTDGQGSYTTLHDCIFFTGTLTAAKREAKQSGITAAKSIGRVRELVIDVLP